MMLAARTERAYRRAAGRFEQRIVASGATPGALAYVRAMTDFSPSLTDASWRFLRAAVKWWISVTISTDEAEQFTRLFPYSRPECKPKKRLPKRLPERVSTDLVAVLQSGPTGANKQIAADMLIAGVATGLRPVEWSRARLKGNTLYVQNAKYRPGISGNGKERVLLLVDGVITDEQRAAIKRLIVALAGREWDEVGGNIRRAFNAAKDRLKTMKLLTPFQTRTRLYEARHQFSANAKMTLDYAGGEVAAAMGQRSAMTARVSYGNRRKAVGTLPVKPSTESVAAVDPKSISRLTASLSRIARFVARAAGYESPSKGRGLSPVKGARASPIDLPRNTRDTS